MLSRLKAVEYLNEQMSSWAHIGSDTAGLFGTYQNSNARCDVYDNALLANALIMFNPKIPDSNVLKILEFFYGAYIFIRGSKANVENPPKLIAAAYTQNSNGDIDVCNDVTCSVQDVGNNALVLISLVKFCLFYPQHANKNKYVEMIEYLLTNIKSLIVNCGLTGYQGRVNPPTDERYISTEHMIDLYALAKMCQGLVRQPVSSMIRYTREFYQAMYYKEDKFAAYRIGVSVSDLDDLKQKCEMNMDSPQPVDTTTWGLLANVDYDEEKMTAAMQTVCRSFVVDDAEHPGIKFTIASDCVQMENTGSFLCSLQTYKQIFNKEFNCPAAKMMLQSILKTINSQKPIPGSYPDRCETGLGWDYRSEGHLAATVYCCLAACQDSNLNIYQMAKQNNIKDECSPSRTNGYKITTIVLAVIVVVFIGVIIYLGKRKI